MHDSWPKRSAYCRQALASLKAVQQCCDQGAAVHSRARVDDHSSRFVYHRDVLIFVNDIQRNIFRFHARKRRGGNIYGDFFASLEAMRGFLRRAIHENASVVDETLHVGPTYIAQVRREKTV